MGIEGKNKPERKVRLVLTLGAHAGYREARIAQREAHLRLANAERWAELARQQCRLLRGATRLGAFVEE